MSTITTFLRPNAHMINLMINNVCGGGEGVRVVKGHRCIVQLKLTPSTIQLEETNPASSTQRAKRPSYFGGDEILEVGVSFSQLDEKTFSHMANVRHGKSISQYMSKVQVVTEKLQATQVPNLYTNGTNMYYWLVPLQRSVKEQEYASLLAGFDLYYLYSDSHEVYKRANDKLKEIEAKGKDLGLSQEVMDRIFREESGNF